LVKDGQSLVLNTIEYGPNNIFEIFGPGNTTTSLIVGNPFQGILIGANGVVTVQSAINSEAPVIIAGAPGVGEINGGDVYIFGGTTDLGQYGSVLIEGQQVQIGAVSLVELFALEAVSVSANDYTWFFGYDGNIEFPDGTNQYTAYQGSTIISDTAPNDDLGRIWFNSVDGRAYVKYNDLWADLSPIVVPDPEIYLEGLTIEDTTIGVRDTTATQTVNVAGNIVPTDNLAYNLGSPTHQWNALYVSSSTIYMSGRALSLTNEGLKVDGGTPVGVIDGGDASTWLTAI